MKRNPHDEVYWTEKQQEAHLLGVRSNELLDGIIHKLARRIADDLFTNGQGQRGVRLVLKLNDIDTGGGWCKSAVIDRVETILKSAI